MKLRLPLALALTTVVTYVVVLPVLYFDLAGVVTHSHEALFVGDANTLTRLLTRQFEAANVIDSPTSAVEILDMAILNGNGLYAELRGPGVQLRSQLGDPSVRFPTQADLGFGEGGDHIYFVRAPLEHAGRHYVLQLGFDERNTVRTIEGAKHRMLYGLGAYLGVSTLAGLALGYLITRPLRRLQRIAREVVGDPNSQSLIVGTAIEEVSDLATDLQHMRESLVAASRRLQHRERLETVGTLAGGIAHEFNNVLVPIILLTERSLKGQAGGNVDSGDLEIVLAAAQRARVLVRQILTFSRELEVMALGSVDLPDVVAEAMGLFRPLIAPGVHLDVSLPDACPTVMADRSLVVQLVMNLCTNAYQALRGGVGTVAVGVAPRTVVAGELAGIDAGGYVELLVRDSGEGMDAEVTARIFEPFFTTRPVGKGTGLGLSVVHGIVQGFGAKILVESAPGAGSTFRVLFPLASQS